MYTNAQLVPSEIQSDKSIIYMYIVTLLTGWVVFMLPYPRSIELQPSVTGTVCENAVLKFNVSN